MILFVFIVIIVCLAGYFIMDSGNPRSPNQAKDYKMLWLEKLGENNKVQLRRIKEAAKENPRLVSQILNDWESIQNKIDTAWDTFRDLSYTDAGMGKTYTEEQEKKMLWQY